jgi:hypothetical protein
MFQLHTRGWRKCYQGNGTTDVCVELELSFRRVSKTSAETTAPFVMSAICPSECTRATLKGRILVKFAV